MIRAIVATLCALAALHGASALEVHGEKSPAGVSYSRVALPEANTQNLQLTWRDGTVFRRPGKEDIGHFAAIMMHEGPKGEKRGEINELMRDLQGSFQFRVGQETTSVTLSAPPETFADVAAVLKRFIHDPAFPENRFERFRRERLAAARTWNSRPDSLARRARDQLLIASAPHLATSNYDSEAASRIELADIVAWRRDVLARDNLIIAASGPMQATAVGAVVDALIAGLPEKSAVAPLPPFEFRRVVRRIVIERDVPQTAIEAFGPTSVPHGLDQIKGEIAIARLGGGAGGRLFAALRGKLGATYGVSAAFSFPESRSRVLTITTSVSHDKSRAAIDALAEEYERWWRDGVTEAEFNAILSQQRSGWSERLKQPANVTGILINMAYLDLGASWFDDVTKARQSITRAEVNAFIRQHFPAWPLSMVIVAPSAEGLGADCVVKAAEDLGKCG